MQKGIVLAPFLNDQMCAILILVAKVFHKEGEGQLVAPCPLNLSWVGFPPYLSQLDGIG